MATSPFTLARRVRLSALSGLAILALSIMAIACSSPKKIPSNNFGSITAPASATGTAASSPSSASPSATPDQSPLAEFMVPKFNVTGNIVVKGVDPATNVMESPDNKDDVAYYDFSGRPGFGCASDGKCVNTVLAGHVDWYTGQVGVFWHMKDLSQGDEIELKLGDGTLYKYKVVANTIYKSEDAPLEQILGDTPQESVTLITCDGVFNKQLQEYNSRRIVRAIRET
jgi:LPXTG-site transpeptidase (sortase) family protein